MNLSGELLKGDPDKIEEEFDSRRASPERVHSITQFCQRARAATDRAIMFAGLQAGLRFRGGIANWSMLCLLEKESF